MIELDEAARHTRRRLRLTAVGFLALWCIALAAFVSINLWTGLRNRPYLLEYGSDAGDRFATNATIVLSWLGLVCSVGLITWITSFAVLMRAHEMHPGLRIRVRVASALVIAGTPLVVIGALVVAYWVIVPMIYSGVRF